MIIYFLLCLAGVNLTFSLISISIWIKNKSEFTYLFFTVFSLFSAIYIFIGASFNLLPNEYTFYQIASAAIYYAVFPWFILSYIKSSKKVIPTILSIIFVLAFLGFFSEIYIMEFPFWQILAHIGLLGLISVSIYAAIKLKERKESVFIYFLALTVIFTFLALEEIITTYTHTRFLANYINVILPLDFYPLIFSIIVGHKLAVDIYSKSQLEIKIANNELKIKQLRIVELEKDVLEKKLTLKNKDLTDFGIKLNKNSEDLKKVLERIDKYKKNNKVKSKEIDKLISDLKTRLRIDSRQEIFYKKIEEVNHEYIDFIKEKYPSLTENEINLICLLKLKLTTKEIASIKNISPDSVKVLRHRIRKKLKLESKTNLTTFLNSIK